jgi:uncharacterized protein
MHDIGPFAPAVWRARLGKARQQRGDYLCGLLKCLRGRVCEQLRTHGRGIGFVTLIAVCLALLHRHGHHLDIIMAAITLASLVSSIAGFAFSAICGAMLFHLADNPVQVVQLMVVCSIANQTRMTWSSRNDINWAELGVYLAGGFVGLAAGVWILLHTDHARYAPALGVFLVIYGGYMFLRKPVVVRSQHAVFDFASGLLGGVTGGAAAFPGAFVTIWCGMKGWDKTRQRAVSQPFILIIQVSTLLAISLVRRHGAAGFALDPNDLLFIPASLFGTSVGLALYRRLSDGQFTRAVNVLLIVSGLSYIA